MEVNDLQSARDLNFRVELTNIDLCANFYLPSFTRDFSIPKINFACNSSLNAPPFEKNHSHLKPLLSHRFTTIVVKQLSKNLGNKEIASSNPDQSKTFQIGLYFIGTPLYYEDIGIS